MSQAWEDEFSLADLFGPSYEDIEEQNRRLKKALRPFADACEALGVRRGDDGAFCWDALDIRQDPDGTFHWTGPASPGFGPTDLGRTAISFRGTGTEASA